MNHKERMQACLTGSPVDRPPVALWRHFPVDDQDPTTLAASILRFQEMYDFDFIKITPASSYCLRDYGVIDEWRGNPEGTRDFLFRPINKPEDWNTLPRILPENSQLQMQLNCLNQIKAGVAENTPYIQTIFDPMSQAKNLVGRETLLVHMRQNPKALHTGLSRIAENTIAFIKKCIPLGIDGIFLAVQHAQASLLSEAELEEFVLPYIREILSYVQDLWLNVIHLHGKDVFFSQLSYLSASVINWHDQETTPDLADAKAQFSGAVCGGLRQWETLVYGTPESVQKEAQHAIKITEGNRFILGTGCVLPITAPHANIAAVRKAVEIGD
jgi:uroporphyrinogen decarboxylase